MEETGSEPKTNRLWKFVAFFLSMVAMLLSGPLLSHSLAILDCITVKLPLVSGGIVDWQPVSVWIHQTRVTCYEEDHLIAAILAWIQLLVIVIFVPLFLFLMAYGKLKLHFSHRSSGAKPSTKRERCFGFCGVSDEEHELLRKDRPMLVIFSFGQPWLRPFMMVLLILNALLSHYLEVETYPVVRLITLGCLNAASCVLFALPCVKTDYRWSKWKSFPRVFIAANSCSLVVLQSFIVVYTPENTVATIAAWVAVVWSLSLPAVVIGSMMLWITKLTTCGEFWSFLQCRSTKGSRRALRANVLLDFVLSQRSEDRAREFVSYHGKHCIVENMKTPDPWKNFAQLQKQHENPEVRQRGLKPGLPPQRSAFRPQRAKSNLQFVTSQLDTAEFLTMKSNPLYAIMQQKRREKQEHLQKPSKDTFIAPSQDCHSQLLTTPPESLEQLRPFATRRHRHDGRARQIQSQKKISAADVHRRLVPKLPKGHLVQQRLRSYAEDLAKSIS